MPASPAAAALHPASQLQGAVRQLGVACRIVNRFKLRTDCLTHNIAGMGCSAGMLGCAQGLAAPAGS